MDWIAVVILLVFGALSWLESLARKRRHTSPGGRGPAGRVGERPRARTAEGRPARVRAAEDRAARARAAEARGAKARAAEARRPARVAELEEELRRRLEAEGVVFEAPPWETVPEPVTLEVPPEPVTLEVPPEPVSLEEGPPPWQVAEVVEAAAVPEEAAAEPARRAETAAETVARWRRRARWPEFPHLSPVQRAIVWTEILAPPVSERTRGPTTPLGLPD